jgi:hypothetical protein
MIVAVCKRRPSPDGRTGSTSVAHGSSSQRGGKERREEATARVAGVNVRLDVAKQVDSKMVSIFEAENAKGNSS